MKRDLPYEALAEATSTDMTAGRGELNAALKSIRGQTPLIGQMLAGEIKVRARQYRRLMPNAVLTPTALSKHWVRVAEEAERPTGTNLHSTGQCSTCQGDRFVLVTDDEQYAPCPSCGPEDVHWWRPDGTRVQTPDPARVRELMRR